MLSNLRDRETWGLNYQHDIMSRSSVVGMARKSHPTWDKRLPDERKILTRQSNKRLETALVAPDAKSSGYGALKSSSLVDSQQNAALVWTARLLI